jgi:hypothetical protein
LWVLYIGIKLAHIRKEMSFFATVTDFRFKGYKIDFQVEKTAKQLEKEAKKAAKMEKFKEKLQKKPTEAEASKETKPKDTKAKSAKPDSATKDAITGKTYIH